MDSKIVSFDHGRYLLGQDIRDIVADDRCAEYFYGSLENVTWIDGSYSCTWRQAYIGEAGYIVMHWQDGYYLRLYFLIVDDAGAVISYLHASPGVYKFKNGILIYWSSTSIYTFRLEQKESCEHADEDEE